MVPEGMKHIVAVHISHVKRHNQFHMKELKQMKNQHDVWSE